MGKLLKLVRRIFIAAAIVLVIVGGILGLINYRRDCLMHPTVAYSGSGDTRIICVGDSITYGQGTFWTRRWNSYEAKLSKILGDDYTIVNYGYSNRNVISTGIRPYIIEDYYEQSLAEDADIVIIMLGTNDTKACNWDEDLFENEYRAFVQSYIDMDSNPDVYVMIPPVIYKEPEEDRDCDEVCLEQNVIPAIERVIEDTGVGRIDLFTLTEGHENWYSDGLHPNGYGNEKIAEAIAEVIQ